jgi:hypothetical protein
VADIEEALQSNETESKIQRGQGIVYINKLNDVSISAFLVDDDGSIAESKVQRKCLLKNPSFRKEHISWMSMYHQMMGVDVITQQIKLKIESSKNILKRMYPLLVSRPRNMRDTNDRSIADGATNSNLMRLPTVAEISQMKYRLEMKTNGKRSGTFNRRP